MAGDRSEESPERWEAQLRSTGRVEFHLARRRALLALAGSVAFVALGVWIFGDSSRVGGSFVAGFFGLCAVLLVYQLLTSARPLLVVTASGAEVRAHREPVAWSEVEDVQVVRAGRLRMLQLLVTRPGRAPRTVYAATSTTDVDIDALRDWLAARASVS